MTIAAVRTLSAVVLGTYVVVALPPPAARADNSVPSLPAVQANDNRTPAGLLRDGTLTLELRAAAGEWRPESFGPRAVLIQAFGEGSSPLSSPGPLIRVPEGTLIDVSIRNELAFALRVHGLCDRSAAGCTPVEIPPLDQRRVQFTSGAAGTYQYWATTTGMPQNFRGADDSQLGGAFIVDKPSTGSHVDRVFVISEWTSLTIAQLKAIGSAIDPGAAFLALRPDVVFSLNGRTWPHTERLVYRRAEPVRWHIVNLSTQTHPMHLHGFYFKVEGVGDGVRMLASGPASKPMVVTQSMSPGSTMVMSWTPERAGNWLFHCHVMTHISPTLHVDGSSKVSDASHQHDALSLGMTGMVLGVTVLDPDGSPTERLAEHAPARKLTMIMQEEPRRFGDASGLGFVLATPQAVAVERLPIPGPPLLLTRGEPVEITLVNRLRESTAIHWHGMELESYYDGAHGFSGAGQRLTPMIEPGASFVVRFTPPRAGTFMYHTHQHDRRQLTSGLYGPMLVTEPGEPFDQTVDHVFVIGRHGPEHEAPVVVNGERQLQVAWKAGVRHRIRLINITPDDIVAVTLQTTEGPLVWRPVAKDGAQLPSDRTEPKAATVVAAVGETYDFEVDAPRGRRNVWLDVTSPAGRWLT